MDEQSVGILRSGLGMRRAKRLAFSTALVKQVMESGHNPGRTAIRAIWLIAAGFLLPFFFAPLSLTQVKNPVGPPPALSRVIVPDVRGRTLEYAQSLLEKAGLTLGTTTQSAGPGAIGTVWRQNPRAGSVVARGMSVNLDVVPQKSQPAPSHGDEEFSRTVPSLIGYTQTQATQLLTRSSLKLGKVTEGGGTGAEGTIYAQDPQPGRWVPVLSSVNVQVVRLKKTLGSSEEFPWRIVPSLHGQTAKAAAQILVQSGLRIGNVSSGNASAPVGTIYSQEPSANSRVRSDTSVNVWVAEAKPAPTVSVPNLIHRDINSARAFLEHSRLRLGQVGHQESGDSIGLITSQSPQPGTRVEVGTPVNVVVAQERPLVRVPDVIKRDEGTAASTLSRAGLQMGCGEPKGFG